MSPLTSIAKPSLRLFYKLDENELSPEFIEKVSIEEGTLPYVDANRARDFWQTEEIGFFRTGIAIVDEEGDIVAEFGKDEITKAEAAIKGAKLTFTLEVPEVDPLEDLDVEDAPGAAQPE